LGSGVCEYWKSFLSVMVVRLVHVMHQEELCSVINRSLHFPGPFLSWNLGVGPKWLDVGHEAAVLHLLLWIVAVPASIVEMLLGHPIDCLLHPPVFLVPENEQCQDHVAGEARLLPIRPLSWDARVREKSRFLL
jgi:hypothetical protein